MDALDQLMTAGKGVIATSLCGLAHFTRDDVTFFIAVAVGSLTIANLAWDMTRKLRGKRKEHK
jgi:hypothetical protein